MKSLGSDSPLFLTLNDFMRISFKAKVWLYDGPAAWHFITLPKDIAAEINHSHGHLKRGWGSLPVAVTIGDSRWETSIFPDKKSGSYILPLKKAVRMAEGLRDGDYAEVGLEL